MITEKYAIALKENLENSIVNEIELIIRSIGISSIAILNIDEIK